MRRRDARSPEMTGVQHSAFTGLRGSLALRDLIKDRLKWVLGLRTLQQALREPLPHVPVNLQDVGVVFEPLLQPVENVDEVAATNLVHVEKVIDKPLQESERIGRLGI